MQGSGSDAEVKTQSQSRCVAAGLTMWALRGPMNVRQLMHHASATIKNAVQIHRFAYNHEDTTDAAVRHFRRLSWHTLDIRLLIIGHVNELLQSVPGCPVVRSSSRCPVACPSVPSRDPWLMSGL